MAWIKEFLYSYYEKIAQEKTCLIFKSGANKACDGTDPGLHCGEISVLIQIQQEK